MGRKRAHTRRAPRSNPRGVIDLHRGGFGFVKTAEGEFFIPRDRTDGAFPSDVVEVAPATERSKRQGGSRKPSDGKREARVVRVLERAHGDVVGHFRRVEPFGIVEPLDPLIQHDIFTQLSESPSVPDGAIVRVAITTYPDRRSAATGVVVEVLGEEDDERVPVDMVVANHNLETEFSDAAIDQASRAQVDEEGALADGYRDLRNRFVFTIDPSDARDFDDAVSIELMEGRRGPATNGAVWRIGVHIADVSHYVPWNCPVDVDARKRATSVYLVDRVIPMLPEALSNDVCSLRPHESRRSMTVDLFVDASGQVVDMEAYPALIESNARLTYEEAQGYLDGAGFLETDVSVAFSEDDLAGRICALSHIAKQRYALRKAAGGLDFDTTEAKVRLDGEGRPVAIDVREKTDATQLIEEAMIMANEAVAQFLHDASFPCLYRVHDKPAPDTLEALVPVLQEFTWFNKVSVPLFCAGNPHEVAKVLDSVKGRPEAALVCTLVLRSMKRAVYSPVLSGHYGLASKAYAHFTSPIRRYPDLVVHRMLKAALTKRPERFDQEVSKLAWIAEHSSEMERVAERAARDSQEVKIVEFMEAHVGETFSALISGVSTFGLFVQLDNTAEGVVEMAELGDEYFVFDSVRHLLKGSDTGKEYRLGRRIAVRLVAADRRTRELRFRLVGGKSKR